MIDLERLKANTKEVTKVKQQFDGLDFTKVDYDLKGFKPLYPTSTSNFKIKIFYNRPTANIAREFSRHRFVYNDKKFRVQPPCLRSFGQECPVCKTINDIQDVKGKDILKGVMTFQRKCISFAYVEEIISHPDDSVKAGDLVLFIYPKSLLNKLEDILDRCNIPDDANKFFDRNNSISFTLSANPLAASGGDSYNFIPDAVNGPTPIYTGDDADAKFEQLMNSLPSLYDIYMPTEPTEDMIALNQEVANELSKRYLSENSPESTTASLIEGEIKKQQVLKQIPTPVQIQIPVVQPQPQPQIQPQSVSDILQEQANQNAAAQVVHTSTTAQVVQEPQVNTVVNSTPTPTINPELTQTATVSTSTTTAVSGSTLPCFGNYNDLDAKCLICPSSTECSTLKK